MKTDLKKSFSEYYDKYIDKLMNPRLDFEVFFKRWQFIEEEEKCILEDTQQIDQNLVEILRNHGFKVIIEQKYGYVKTIIFCNKRGI